MQIITDTDAWARQADELAADLQQGRSVAVRLKSGRERIIANVLSRTEDAVSIFVPSSIDQVERVLLGLGAALGPTVTEAVDRHLRDTPDDLGPTLHALEEALGDRPIIVDGWDELGAAGIDSELYEALGGRGRAVRAWLAERSGIFMVRLNAPPSAQKRQCPVEAPTELRNGVVRATPFWECFEGETSSYAPALTALSLGASEDELCELSGDGLRRRVFELLPRDALTVLTHLALHARPMSRAKFAAEFDAAVRLGCDLGLWVDTRGALVLDDAWATWVARELTAPERRELHRDLAESFLRDYRLADPTVGRAGLSVLEAHRHLVEANDLDRAQDHARYSAALLVEAARTRSMAKDFRGAADLYAQILRMAADPQRRIPFPQHLRGYARHYLHFNRAHGGMEDLSTTREGYHAALEDWRGNALFWSRYVRVHCYEDNLGAALASLAEAQEAVETHPQKQAFLIARTVRGLLEHHRVLDAVCVWNDYRPEGPQALEVERKLEARLREGWDVGRLHLEPDAPLVFTRNMRVRVDRLGSEWFAEISDLTWYAKGSTPRESLVELARAARAELRRMVRAYTSDLSPSDRLRKRLLFGAVDVRLSRVDAEAPDSYWYFGALERDRDGALYLRTGGDHEYWFEVPAETARDVTVDARPHLARVKTDADGIPTGPVLELSPGFEGTDEALWDAWREAVERAG